MARGKRYISVYESERCFGGHEEGGWYFTVFSLLYTKKYSTSKGTRIKHKRMVNALPSHCVIIESKRDIGHLESINKTTPRYM